MSRQVSTPHHSAEWGVQRCECGQFTLKLGALRIDLSPIEFARLAELLQKAAAHFDVAESASDDSSEATPTTH